MPMSGTVHLGAVVSAVRPLIQATLALKARHAALDLHVSAAKSIELVERVQSGSWTRPSPCAKPGARPELVWASLYAEPMVLLAPRKLEESSARVILQQPALHPLRPNEHTGRLVERTLRRLRVKPAEVPGAQRAGRHRRTGALGPGRGGGAAAARRALGRRREAARDRDPAGAEERRMALVQRRDSAKATVIGALAREFLS